MNRRQFIGGTAAISLAAATTLANAHSNHDHGSHSHAANSTDNAYEAARKAAGHCVSAGQVCLTHCITLLSKGDTSMKDCAAAVNQMLALCGAMQNLAAQNSRLAPSLAKSASKPANNVRPRAKNMPRIMPNAKPATNLAPTASKSARKSPLNSSDKNGRPSESPHNEYCQSRNIMVSDSIVCRSPAVEGSMIFRRPFYLPAV